ncbi:MAG TPA: penicillin-binding protein activator [Acetobacteraceae bacterium]|nr:penicillin-binding protein activator [Acetobacteraceae bacterium]
MDRRTLLLLAGSLGLSACSVGPAPGPYPAGGIGPAGPYAPGTGPSGPESLNGLPPGTPPGYAPTGPVAILLPLSGRLAGIGQAMGEAAQLALAAPGSPPLLSEDTGGTPEGAAAAARTALAGGARLILGPLTAPETAAAAPIALGAGVPMLAFTNDSTVARPGVWTLGITPGQQVRQLVRAGQRQGRTRFAALLPDSPLGQLMGQALAAATSAAALPSPTIRFHSGSMGSINTTARSLSDYDGRWGPIEAQIRAARATGTLAGRRQAASLRKSVPPPPPFDALLLADTGETLHELAAVLSYYVVGRPSVQIMGPSLWADPRSGAGHLPGAWYAAPETSSRAAFVASYAARYGGAPPGVADLGYDAGGLARFLAAGGYRPADLTAPRGFAGTDGWLVLRPDGHVRRGLAVYAVGGAGGPQLVQPPSAGPGAGV